MKKISRFVLMFLLLNVVTFSFSSADNAESVQPSDPVVIQEQTSQTENSETIKNEGTSINTEDIKEGIKGVTDVGESLAYTIILEVGDKSVPIAFLLVLWGAVLYFILGIRNLYKKRQGLLLMWGAITFVLIAKIMVLVGFFLFEYKA